MRYLIKEREYLGKRKGEKIYARRKTIAYAATKEEARTKLKALPEFINGRKAKRDVWYGGKKVSVWTEKERRTER